MSSLVLKNMELLGLMDLEPLFSISIILIPKTSQADVIDQFRPKALANFKLKIISKVLIDILASIMPSIISKEKKDFVKGKSIRDYIGLACEPINFLHKKSSGGNIALKVYITKAFHSLNWFFLLQVLKAFCFNEKFNN
ncbi:uncharacterized protein LOC127137838 [Lathyrus oleraceus]|uniref:uncharacterized protein LOC127137838 n=1 Tax=Pisum sativum TaxID=3888 RepID=UPI0021D1CA96|nr:uncharacterized protein LOC127137838 [Pisum sativum]